MHVALGISAEEMNKLLDYPCPDKTKVSIQHLTSLQWAKLKFLSLGVNALLRGSSEHFDLHLTCILHFDYGRDYV